MRLKKKRKKSKKFGVILKTDQNAFDQLKTDIHLSN